MLTPYVWICMCSCGPRDGLWAAEFSDRSDAATICGNWHPWTMLGLGRRSQSGEGDNPGIAVRRRCCGTVWRAVGDLVRVTYNER